MAQGPAIAGPAHTSTNEAFMRVTPLRLTLDELHVDSFIPSDTRAGTGTVYAHAQEDPPFNTVGRIPTCEPCDASNQATCDTCVGPNCKDPSCKDQTAA